MSHKRAKERRKNQPEVSGGESQFYVTFNPQTGNPMTFAATGKNPNEVMVPRSIYAAFGPPEIQERLIRAVEGLYGVRPLVKPLSREKFLVAMTLDFPEQEIHLLGMVTEGKSDLTLLPLTLTGVAFLQREKLPVGDFLTQEEVTKNLVSQLCRVETGIVMVFP